MGVGVFGISCSYEVRSGSVGRGRAANEHTPAAREGGRHWLATNTTLRPGWPLGGV